MRIRGEDSMASGSSFFESKDTAPQKVQKVLNELLHPRFIDDYYERPRIENLIEQLNIDRQLPYNERNLLLACLHLYLSQLSHPLEPKAGVMSAIIDPYYEKEYNKAARFLAVVHPKEFIEKFFRTHLDPRQFKVIYTFGFLCPQLILDYIKNSRLKPMELRVINNIFHIYHPAFKDVLSRLRDTYRHSYDTLFASGWLSETLFANTAKDDIRFLNDLLEIFPDIPYDQRSCTLLLSQIELQLKYLESLMNPKEYPQLSDQQKARFALRIDDYDVFLQKLLKLAENPPFYSIFRQSYGHVFPPLKSKEALIEHIKYLRALKPISLSLPNQDQIFEEWVQKRKWYDKSGNLDKDLQQSFSKEAFKYITQLDISKPFGLDEKTTSAQFEELRKKIDTFFEGKGFGGHKTMAEEFMEYIQQRMLHPLGLAVVAAAAPDGALESKGTKGPRPPL